jgi:hypothetical protein
MNGRTSTGEKLKDVFLSYQKEYSKPVNGVMSN